MERKNIYGANRAFGLRIKGEQNLDTFAES